MRAFARAQRPSQRRRPNPIRSSRCRFRRRCPRPIYRPKPDYPERALRFKREGVVELEFSIEVDGSVRDVRVLKSEAEGLFDRAAIKALGKWRDGPQLVNGVAVERPKVRLRLIFKLDDA